MLFQDIVSLIFGQEISVTQLCTRAFLKDPASVRTQGHQNNVKTQEVDTSRFFLYICRLNGFEYG